MANYAGSRANALINSIAMEKNGSIKDIDRLQKDANEEIIKLDKFELKAGKSEHNHSTKRHFK